MAVFAVLAGASGVGGVDYTVGGGGGFTGLGQMEPVLSVDVTKFCNFTLLLSEKMHM